MLAGSMVRAFRIIFAVLAWVFLAALVVQVFFAGLMLFGEPSGRDLHEDTGWMLHTAVILLPVTAALGRAGLRPILYAVALTVTTGVQPFLAMLREMPAIAALHPVNAVAMIILALLVARDALRLTRPQARLRPG